eukprot:740138-Prymnesium_polylepis.2
MVRTRSWPLYVVVNSCAKWTHKASLNVQKQQRPGVVRLAVSLPAAVRPRRGPGRVPGRPLSPRVVPPRLPRHVSRCAPTAQRPSSQSSCSPGANHGSRS